MPGAELSTSARDGHVVVALRGDVDVTGAADAGAAITALVVPGRCLIIDMPGLDFVDCGSLAALLRVQWLAWSAGGDVALAAPRRHVLRLLALTGRDHAFLIHASVQAAAAGLPRSRGPARRPAARGEHGTLGGGRRLRVLVPGDRGRGSGGPGGFLARPDARMRTAGPGPVEQGPRMPTRRQPHR